MRGDLGRAQQVGLELLRVLIAPRARTPAVRQSFARQHLVLFGRDGGLASAFECRRPPSRRESQTRYSPCSPARTLDCLQCYLSHVAWHRQDGNLGEDHIEAAIASARVLRRPLSEAIALNYATILRLFQRDSSRALSLGREVVKLCRCHGFPYYLAMANVLTGWAAAAQGDVADGLAQLREGLDVLHSLLPKFACPTVSRGSQKHWGAPVRQVRH
jgi:hypothetical protein